MSDNDIVVEAWNTVLFDKFVRFKHLLIAGLAGHSDELLARRLFRRGACVLDIGCGFGDSTLKIASEVGQEGEAVAVDCAERFVRTAEQEPQVAEARRCVHASGVAQARGQSLAARRRIAGQRDRAGRVARRDE